MPALPQAIVNMNTFSGFLYFFLDEFHLIARGVSQLVFNMLDPNSNDRFMHKDNAQNYDKYTFRFKRDFFPKGKIIEDISGRINASRSMIPTTFQGSWTSINRGYYRGIDWLDTFLYVLPSIILWRLEDGNAKKALMHLINGCALALQWRIETRNLTKIRL